MTTYSISAPDGKTYEIEGPAGATQEQVQNEVIRQNPHLAGSPQPAESVAVAERTVQPAQSTVGKASGLDIVAGLPATRMLAGAAAPFVGALQAGANIGDWLSEKMGQDPVLGKYIAEKVGEYEAAKKRGMVALGDTGADVAGFAGSAATGAAALKGITPAAGYLGRIGQGAAIGAGAGATTPSSTPGVENTLMQTVLGGALGGGIPAAQPIISKGGQAAYRTLIEPLTNRNAIKGRAYMEAAGPKAQEITNALRASQPIVPGSMPTAGEAAIGAGRAEFSALQKSAERVAPSDYVARATARDAARVNQLNQVAGTEADMLAVQSTRAKSAAQNYGAAKAGPAIKTNAALEEVFARPVMGKVMGVAKTIAENSGKTFGMGAKPASTTGGTIGTHKFKSAVTHTPATPADYAVADLHNVKMALDKMIAKPDTFGIDAAEVEAIKTARKAFLTEFERQSPGYAQARSTFAAQSKPINQMEVGQYLKDKLVPALDESAPQKAASFAGAVRDAPGTIKRALTGAPRYEKLTDVLTPDQFAKIEAIRQDLANTARQELLAQKGAQAAPNAVDIASQSVASATGGGRIPNPLSRVVTIANAIIARLEGKIDKKLAIEIAAEMLEPQKVAAVMEKEIAKGAKAATKAAVVNKLRPTATAAGVNALVTSAQTTD